MKRSARFAIPRGLELTIANWPLLLFPIGESIVALFMDTGAIAALVQMLDAAGLGSLAYSEPSLPNRSEWRLAFTNHWPLLLLIVFFVIIVGLFEAALHSFIQAGAADVYIAADRQDVRFTVTRWFAGGRRGWRHVLGIYAIWLVVAVVLLLPLLPIPLVSVGWGGGLAPCVMTIGCALLALWGCFAVVIIVMTFVWTLKAIVVAIARDCPAIEAFGHALVSIGSNLGAHIAVTLLMVLIWWGGLLLLSSLSGVRDFRLSVLMSNPAELALWFLGISFFSAMQNWFLASYAALTEVANARVRPAFA